MRSEKRWALRCRMLTTRLYSYAYIRGSRTSILINNKCVGILLSRLKASPGLRLEETQGCIDLAFKASRTRHRGKALHFFSFQRSLIQLLTNATTPVVTKRLLQFRHLLCQRARIIITHSGKSFVPILGLITSSSVIRIRDPRYPTSS